MLSDRRPILLTNARIIDPSRELDFPGDLLMADGVIREAKRGIGAAGVPEGTEVVDCRDRIVAPGLIDMRAFLGEPGAGHRETIATASAAAALGGITTVLAMPDTNPPVDGSAAVQFVLQRAHETSCVRILPAAALTKGLAGVEIAEFGLLQEAGACAFSNGLQSVRSSQVMRRAMAYARDFDALVIHQCEDPDLGRSGVMREGELATRMGLAGVPPEAETIVLDRDMRLVAMTGARYHAALVSNVLSLDVIAKAKATGLPVTCG